MRSSLLPTLAFYYMVQIGIVHTAKNITSQKKTNRKIGLTCGWMKYCLILMGKRQNWPYIRHSLASDIKCIKMNLCQHRSFAISCILSIMEMQYVCLTCLLYHNIPSAQVFHLRCLRQLFQQIPCPSAAHPLPRQYFLFSCQC